MAQLLLLITLGPVARGAVLLEPGMKTFGSALKSFPYNAGDEQLLYQFSAPATSQPHTVLEQWFSLFGGKERYDRNPDARIRVYIDGDNATGPSLDFQLYFAHTVGVESCTNDHCADPRVPWASKDVQHMAHGGALLNRYKIPFAISIRITVTMPFSGIIYYYARGMTSLPVTVGELQLPPAARLRLYKNWNVTVKPLEKLPLVPNHTGAGLLYATMWSASSEYIGFMEGCVRAEADQGPTVYLSSGTEDYFESANFFSAGQHDGPSNVYDASGEATAPESGVSYLNGTNPSPYGMSAYKFHISDPIVWWQSFELTASNYDGGGEDPAHGPMGCTVPGTAPPLTKDVTMWTYAWTYEW